MLSGPGSMQTSHSSMPSGGCRALRKEGQGRGRRKPLAQSTLVSTLVLHEEYGEWEEWQARLVAS